MRTKRQILDELRRQHEADEKRLDEILADIRGQGLLADERNERRERAYAELSKFNQEVLRRNEIVFREGSAEVAQAGREVRAELVALTKETLEHTEWIRSQTQAILRMLDLLRGEEGPRPEAA